jgi:hypothetical protein
VNHQVNNIFQTLETLARRQDERHQETMNRLIPTHDRVDGISRNVEKIERIVMAIQRDVEGKDYKQHLTELQNAIKVTQTSLTEGLPLTMSNSKSLINPLVIFKLPAYGNLYSRHRSEAKVRPSHLRVRGRPSHGHWCLAALQEAEERRTEEVPLKRSRGSLVSLAQALVDSAIDEALYHSYCFSGYSAGKVCKILVVSGVKASRRTDPINIIKH